MENSQNNITKHYDMILAHSKISNFIKNYSFFNLQTDRKTDIGYFLVQI